MVASLISSVPPRRSNSCIQTGYLVRWSTLCAGRSSMPFQSIAFLPEPSGAGTTKLMESTVGHSLRPEIEADVALVLQRVVEHALAGHHLAGADVLGGAVLHQLDLIAFLQKAACELQAGLASAEYRDLATAHCRSPSSIVCRVIVASFHQQRDRRIDPLGADRRVAAVDPDVGAGDEARRVRQQERHRLGDFRRDRPCGAADGRARRPCRSWRGCRSLSCFMMLLQVQPGDTALTLMPSGARSSAWLRVSCRIAALETG